MGLFSFANIDGRNHQGCWARHHVAGAVAAVSFFGSDKEQKGFVAQRTSSAQYPRDDHADTGKQHTDARYNSSRLTHLQGSNPLHCDSWSNFTCQK